MAPRTRAQQQAEDDKCPNGSKLGPGGNVLEDRASTYTININQGLDRNGRDCNQVSAGEGEMAHGPDRSACFQGRKNFANIKRKARPQGCDGPANAYGKDHPAIEKGHKFAVGFAQVDVLSAGFGKHGAHLGKGKAGQHGNHSTDGPYREK